MKPPNKRAQKSDPFEEGELLRLEMQVARRADTLWRMAGGGRGRDLVHWLQAESDVFDRHFGAEPSVDLMVAER